MNRAVAYEIVMLAAMLAAVSPSTAGNPSVAPNNGPAESGNTDTGNPKVGNTANAAKN